jgi:hypothetical protein
VGSQGINLIEFHPKMMETVAKMPNLFKQKNIPSQISFIRLLLKLSGEFSLLSDNNQPKVF